MNRLERGIAWLRGRPWLRRAVWGGLGLLIAVELLLPRAHGVFWWDALPGFHIVYGVIASVMIILVVSLLARGGLIRGEDYYDD